jgi:lipopolysaccharide/colanic/teichoic acid biosynthesis glycosyltransferase
MRVPVPTSRAARKAHLSFWDVMWASACPILALYLRDALILADGDWGAVGAFWTLSTSLTLISFFVFRIHDEMPRYFSNHNAVDIARAVIFAELMICMALFVLTRLDGIPRSTPFIHGLLLISGLVATRIIVSIFHGEDKSVQYHFRCARIILIGANRFSASFIKLLNAYSPDSPDQQRVIGVLDERPAMVGRAISGVRILGAPQQLEAIIDEFLVHGIRSEQVIVAGEPDLLSPEAAREVLRVCEERQLELSLLPRMIGASVCRPSEIEVPPEPASEMLSFALPTFFALKRWIDLLASIALIALLLPLLTVIALLVLLDVGTPVLFWQRRLGRNGTSFLLYKFRTLRAPFDSRGRPLPESGRLSATGRFLRTRRLDELPQLLNVLTGEMSLIGPRPLLPKDQPSKSAVRLLVRPGITGWAQVNGAELVSREEKEKLDEWYVRNASPRVDLRILIKTLCMVMKISESAEKALADAEQAKSKTFASLRIVDSNAPAAGTSAIAYNPSLRNEGNFRAPGASNPISPVDTRLNSKKATSLRDH